MKSASEWSDDIYETKFRLLNELYLEKGDQAVLDALFDKLESKQLLADTEELVLDAADHFNKKENYQSAAYFYRKLANIKNACRAATVTMYKECGETPVFPRSFLSCFLRRQNGYFVSNRNRV